jgi:hypothetical protein
MPDVMDAKQLAELQISKAVRTTFERPGFSNLADRRAQIGDET